MIARLTSAQQPQARYRPCVVALVLTDRTTTKRPAKKGSRKMFDYDSEYRYDGEPVGALQGLAPDCVVYGGSLSKTLAPGIRLGWLVVPKNLVDGLVDAKYTDDRGSPTLEQLALTRFIACGALDRHRRRSRLRYRETRDRLVDVFRRDAPEVRIEGIAAGLHFLARLPSGADEASLVAAGARRSVGLHGLAEFASPGRAHGPALVMGYGGIPRHADRPGAPPWPTGETPGQSGEH